MQRRTFLKTLVSGAVAAMTPPVTKTVSDVGSIVDTPKVLKPVGKFLSCNVIVSSELTEDAIVCIQDVLKRHMR